MRRFGSFRCSPSQSVLTRGSWFSISLLLSEEVMLADIGFGQFTSPFGVIFAQTALDDLALEVIFYVLDPTPRTLSEVLHQVVAVQGTLELLHGIQSPYLLHPAFQAAPGLLGYAPPSRGAAGYVRPGELEERVHVGELLVAAAEVGVSDEASHGRVAPGLAARGIPVRAHVVCDQVSNGVDVVLGVGEALHRLSRYRGADVLVAVEVDLLGQGAPTAALALALIGGLPNALGAAIGAAVLVDERSRLADVVEKGRLAQDGIFLDVLRHYEGVLEDVLVVELRLLLDVQRLQELRHDVPHEVEAHEGTQTSRYVVGGKNLLELLPYALGADAL